MNPQFLHIIRKEVEKAFGKTDKPPLTRYQMAKKVRVVKKTTSRNIINLLLMILGVVSAGFGLKGFLIPNHFIDGGVTGISLLLNQETGISLSVLIIIINLPFVLLGWRQINMIFGIKSWPN